MRMTRQTVLVGSLLGASVLAALAGCMSSLSKETTDEAAAPGPNVLASRAAQGVGPDDGYVSPPYPTFPRGNQLSQALADNSSQVEQFLNFYSKQAGVTFPSLSRSQLVGLPNRYLDLADNGLNLSTNHFNSSLVCQSCHDSDWQIGGSNLPNMTYWGQPSVSTTYPPPMPGKPPSPLAANWSLFGDWSASIKALAGRDPVFLAQVENTRNLSPKQPQAVDNLCLRCHSPLGQRQAESNHYSFSHYMLYSTPSGSGYTNPFPQEQFSQAQFSVYGALGRDGISCSSCHAMGPNSGQPWNGTDYSVFYGNPSQNVYGNNVSNRLKSAGDGVQPPPYPFSSSMNLVPGAITGPDTGLNVAPMAAAGLNLQTATNASGDHSYLRDSTVCGACHVVILPKVPTNYSATLKVQDAVSHGAYERPASCSTTQEYFTGNFLNDPCVPLAYEQTTYFEWLNSGFAPSTATCLTCHMQLAQPATPYDNNVKVAQKNPALAAYYADNGSLVPRQYNRHSLLGVNLFVHNMFQQFSDVLGIQYYKQDDSHIPPYLQSPDVLNRTPILIPNPGAESGNANTWTAAAGSTIQAVQKASGAQGQNITPSHGKYFFQVGGSGGTASLTVDVSQYASIIDQADDAVSVLWGGAVYCDKPFACGQLVLTPLGSGSSQLGTPGTISPQADQSRWTSQQGTLRLKKGTRSLTLSLAPGQVDDLFLSLRFPDGTVSPLQETAKDYAVAKNLLNAEQSILDLATNTSQGVFNPQMPAAQVSVGKPTQGTNTLNVDVTVTSNVGHKFPSGAGFRRAFLQFEVLDGSGNVLWASGQPNALGAICAGRCNAAGDNILPSEFASNYTQLEPHHQIITSENQVQIYEAKVVDDFNKVTSTELQQFKDVKDNRILPKGWVPPSERNGSDSLLGLNLLQMAKLTEPSSIILGPNDTSISSDPDYNSSKKTGADHLTYQVPLSRIAGWKSVRVRLNYQTIPPSYLNARFKEALSAGNPGPAMQRLIYMTSRLNNATGLKFAPNPNAPDKQIDFTNNWSMVLGEATSSP